MPSGASYVYKDYSTYEAHPLEAKREQGMNKARDLWFDNEVFPLERELRAYLRRFFSNEDAKDIVQQCYAQICAMPDYRVIVSPRAFLFTTARNVAVSRIRQASIVPLELMEEMETLATVDNSAPDAERIASAREELGLLSKAIDKMPDQCRHVFTLRKVYGFSQKEIAEKLGIAVHTVEKHISHGVRLCAEFLASYEEVPRKRHRLSILTKKESKVYGNESE